MSATIHPALAEGRRLPNAWDAAAILCVFAALIGVAHEAPSTFERIDAPQALAVSLDPIHLPDYALRTTLRMFAALVASLLFTFTLRHRRGEEPPRRAGPDPDARHPAVGADPRAS